MTGAIKLTALEEHFRDLLERIEEMYESVQDYFRSRKKNSR